MTVDEYLDKLAEGGEMDEVVLENSSLKNIIDGFKKLSQAIQEIRSFLNRPEIKQAVRVLVESWRNLPDDTKRFIRDLAYRGWFFTSEMTLNEMAVFYNLTTSQKSADEDRIDECMEDLVGKYIPQIKQTMYDRYPLRENVLSDAFNAHDRGEYNLSIPVFLAQADGIGMQLLNGVSPFSRKTASGGILVTAAEIQTLSLHVDTLLIDPLGLPLAFTAKSTSAERLQHAHLYNRHEVLHGLSTDYGTKRNSLKAVSLLGHLTTVVHDVVEDYKTTLSPSTSNP